MHDGPPPYFTLQIGACFCRCDVRVNDIPVFVQDVSGARADIEMPLNPLVFTGENTLSVRVLPARSSPQAPAYDLDSSHVECSAALMRRDGADGPRTTLASVVFQGGSAEPFAGSSVEEDGVSPLQHTYDPRQLAAGARSVQLVTPFPEWRWVGAPPIEADELVLRDLLAEHQRFWALLRAKNLPELRDVMAVNARELQLAYYLPDLEYAYNAIGVEALLRNPEATLKPMPADVHLEVFAGGRLARIVTEDGDSPIYFYEGDTGLDAHIGAWFCRGPSATWVMVR